ncbi:hypothetical protein [Mesorhizobium abyssinicae]|uniref:hypothetical protein n=1 Tax=Mesorhizobium abyssinicae TaxID=1209958 RepID=UPI0033937A71
MTLIKLTAARIIVDLKQLGTEQCRVGLPERSVRSLGQCVASTDVASDKRHNDD